MNQKMLFAVAVLNIALWSLACHEFYEAGYSNGQRDTLDEWNKSEAKLKEAIESLETAVHKSSRSNYYRGDAAEIVRNAKEQPYYGGLQLGGPVNGGGGDYAAAQDWDAMTDDERQAYVDGLNEQRIK